MNPNTPARRTQAAVQKAPGAAKAEQTVQDMIRSSWSAIAASLPDSMDSKRFARLTFNAVRKTPKLALATSTSMVGAVLTASALGLEIGLNNEAHLVPYLRKNRSTGEEWMEAQLQVGYGGYVKLFQQHPMARGVATGWVGANDKFDYAYGTASFLDHRPVLGNRGKPIAFWASYELSNGVRDFLVLSPEEVAELRGKGVDEKRDIADPQHWMERKTVLKQVLKLAPKSTSLQWAMAVDEKSGADLERVPVAIDAGDAIPDQIAPRSGDVEGDVVDEVTGEVLEERGVDGQGGEDPAVHVPNGHSREADDQAAEVPPSSREASAAAPPARPAPRGGNAGDVSPAAVDGEAAAGTSSPAAASAPIRQHQPEPEPEVSAPVYTPAPIRASQKPKLREQCIRLEIQANAAEKFMWFDMILGLDEPLQQVEQLNSAQAQTLIDTLTGFADHAALEAWGKNQQPLIDGEG